MHGALRGQRERPAAATVTGAAAAPARPPPPRPAAAAASEGRLGKPACDFSADFRTVCGFTCQAIKMMSMNSKQPHFAMHPTLPEHKYPSLHSSSEAIRRACLPTPPVSAPRSPGPERLHVGCWCLHRSRCGDLRAGVFRGIPLRGTFCTVALKFVFPSALPLYRAPVSRVGNSGTVTVDFPPLSLLISCLGKAVSVRVRVRDTRPQLRVTSPFLLFPSFFFSLARSRNVFLFPSLLPLHPSPHCRPFSSVSPSCPQCVPHSVFTGLH